MEERRWFNRYLEISSVPALLLLLLTVFIGIGYLVRGPDSIPPILSHGFAVVLGYYFGARLNKSKV